MDEIETGPATGGRHPILLAINPRYGYVVGIDLGATQVGMVVTDYSAHVLDEIEQPFLVKNGPKNCLNQIDQYLTELLHRLKLEISYISTIGLGVTGPVIAEAGMVSSPPHYARMGWIPNPDPP